MPVIKFQMTNLISLKKLKNDIPKFMVPRMYYYLDGTELLDYLNQNLHTVGAPIINDFENFIDVDIC